jgi:hypothetical protein
MKKNNGHNKAMDVPKVILYVKFVSLLSHGSPVLEGDA